MGSKAVGMSLGSIEILEQVSEQFKDGTYKWRARCGCGKEFLVRKRNVEKGHTKSCGCLRKLAARARNLRREPPSPEDTLEVQIDTKFYRYEQSAKVKALDFELDSSSFRKLVTSPCHYCGMFIGDINGIDRVDNSVGYLKSNCIPCCSGCNYLKGSMDYNTFVKTVHLISDNMKKYGGK